MGSWCGAPKFDGKNVSMLLALMGVVFWPVASSIGPSIEPEARATVTAAIGVAYTLLIVFELWRGRGDQGGAGRSWCCSSPTPLPFQSTFQLLGS